MKFEINVIDDFFYYKVFEANKIDNEYNKIREMIINNKKKLRNIIFNKYVITNNIFYYKNCL